MRDREGECFIYAGMVHINKIKVWGDLSPLELRLESLKEPKRNGKTLNIFVRENRCAQRESQKAAARWLWRSSIIIKYMKIL